MVNRLTLRKQRLPHENMADPTKTKGDAGLEKIAKIPFDFGVHLKKP